MIFYLFVGYTIYDHDPDSIDWLDRIRLFGAKIAKWRLLIGSKRSLCSFPRYSHCKDLYSVTTGYIILVTCCKDLDSPRIPSLCFFLPPF